MYVLSNTEISALGCMLGSVAKALQTLRGRRPWLCDSLAVGVAMHRMLRGMARGVGVQRVGVGRSHKSCMRRRRTDKFIASDACAFCARRSPRALADWLSAWVMSQAPETSTTPLAVASGALTQLQSNSVFMAGLGAWAIAQALKLFTTFFATRRWRWKVCCDLHPLETQSRSLAS
jgi:hypothetical protein